MIEQILPFLNKTLALGAVAGQVFIVVLVAVLLLNNRQEHRSRFLVLVSSHAFLLGFVVALFSLVFSLFYSNVVGYEPCSLCWWQRIFMYPLVLLFGMALWKKDMHIVDYALGLSILGALVALYNHYIQLGGSPLVPCSSAVSCAQRFVFEFGYMSIPLMSFTGFLIIVVSLIVQKKVTK